VPHRPRDPEAGRVLSAIADAMMSIGLMIGLPCPFYLPRVTEPRKADVFIPHPSERPR
jgi:hypothetical protein